MLCRKRSSTSAVSPSSPFPGHGPSRSNWPATRSRILPTALRCFASAPHNVASAGHSLESSSGLWSVAGRWDMPDTSPRRSSSSVSVYRMRSVARFPLIRMACQWRGRRARSRSISRNLTIPIQNPLRSTLPLMASPFLLKLLFIYRM